MPPPVKFVILPSLSIQYVGHCGTRIFAPPTADWNSSSPKIPALFASSVTEGSVFSVPPSPRPCNQTTKVLLPPSGV